MPGTANEINNLWQEKSQVLEETHCSETTNDIAVPKDQGISQPSSEILPTLESNQQRLQLSSVWRIRTFRMLSPKWDIYITLLPSRVKDLSGRGEERLLGSEMMAYYKDGLLQCLLVLFWFLHTTRQMHIRTHSNCGSMHKTWASPGQTKLQHVGQAGHSSSLRSYVIASGKDRANLMCDP